nr:cache domain-containing protein [Pseudoruegeria sp. HB172150]
MIEHARDLLREAGINTAEHSKGFLQPAESAAELAARLAENSVVASDNPELVEKLLFQQLLITPQFSGLYYGGRDGDFVYVMRAHDGPAEFRSKIIRADGGSRWTELIWRNDDFTQVERGLDPEDTYDPRSRPWYKKAVRESTTIWTDPYIFFTSQQPGITLASPVLQEDGAIRGVIGVDIEISAISEFLARLSIGEHGSALIINHNGDVVAHPDQELIKILTSDGTLRFSEISEIDDPIARAAFGPLALAGGFPVEVETQSQFTYHNSSYVASILPVISKKLPWTIAVYAPEGDFTGALKQNRRQNMWFAVLVTLGTSLIALVVSRYIYRPVRDFEIRTTKISSGEIDPDAPAPKTYRELERANSALAKEAVARREAELEYGETFRLSPQGMAQISPETGAIIRVNARFCAITGFSEPELLQMHFADIAHPEETVPRLFGHGADGHDISVNRLMRCVRKDKTVIWATVNVILIRDQKGTLLHSVMTMEDVTSAKATEDQIKKLNKDISHLARGNTMGQMAKGLAHELNQPLTAIAQNADTALLVLSQDDADMSEMREILSAIEGQSLRAGEIIHALRDFIQKDGSAKSVFTFEDLLHQTLHLVRAEANEAGVTVETRLEPNLPPVYANRVQIAQVLVNLFHNAFEALTASSVRDRRVHVLAVRDGGLLKVSVQDNGPGIDSGINLFNQFETTKSAGMGLGLSICQSIVEANGGTIWNESTDTCGALFHFTVTLQLRSEATSRRPTEDSYAISDFDVRGETGT